MNLGKCISMQARFRIALRVVLVTAAAIVLLFLRTPATAQLVEVTETEDGWVYVWDPDYVLISKNQNTLGGFIGGGESVDGALFDSDILPEPTTFALSALSAISLLSFAWRRRRDAARIA